MTHSENALKRALRDGRPQIGLWSSLCSNLVAELLAHTGYDWIVVDSEHAPNDPKDVLSQLQATQNAIVSSIR